MKFRKGKYPNETDFDPYYGKKGTDSEGVYALPLSDPAEAHPIAGFQEEEVNVLGAIEPSAFSENKKIQLNLSVSLV